MSSMNKIYFSIEQAKNTKSQVLGAESSNDTKGNEEEEPSSGKSQMERSG